MTRTLILLMLPVSALCQDFHHRTLFTEINFLRQDHRLKPVFYDSAYQSKLDQMASYVALYVDSTGDTDNIPMDNEDRDVTLFINDDWGSIMGMLDGNDYYLTRKARKVAVSVWQQNGDYVVLIATGY